MKTCSKCKTSKPLYLFHKEKKRQDGHNMWCKDCMNEYARAYQRKTQQGNKWLKANPDKCAAFQNNYRLKNLSDRYSGNNAYCQNQRDSLADSYILKKIQSSNPFLRQVTINDISGIASPELVEAKRAHIKLKRKLKEMQR